MFPKGYLLTPACEVIQVCLCQESFGGTSQGDTWLLQSLCHANVQLSWSHQGHLPEDWNAHRGSQPSSGAELSTVGACAAHAALGAPGEETLGSACSVYQLYLTHWRGRAAQLINRIGFK